jgi:hypothetical protein
MLAFGIFNFLGFVRLAAICVERRSQLGGCPRAVFREELAIVLSGVSLPQAVSIIAGIRRRIRSEPFAMPTTTFRWLEALACALSIVRRPAPRAIFCYRLPTRHS